MEKNFKQEEVIENEIQELKLKISDMKNGYENTIHEFAKGIYLNDK